MTTIAIHHILLKSPLLADDVLKELTLGADFGELACEYSACPSGRQQGFAGFHHVDALPAAVVKALFENEQDSPYTGPVRSAFGYHIFKAIPRPAKPLLVDE